MAPFPKLMGYNIQVTPNCNETNIKAAQAIYKARDSRYLYDMSDCISTAAMKATSKLKFKLSWVVFQMSTCT